MYYSVGSLTWLLESEVLRCFFVVRFTYLVFVSSLSFLVVRRPCFIACLSLGQQRRLIPTQTVPKYRQH